MTTYTLAIPIPVPSQNVLRRRYRNRHAYAALRSKFGLAVLFAKRHANVPEATGKRRMRVVRLVGPRGRMYDYGNLVGGCKPLVDELVKAGLLVDDSPQHVVEEYDQERAPEHGVRIELQDAAE